MAIPSLRLLMLFTQRIPLRIALILVTKKCDVICNVCTSKGNPLASFAVSPFKYPPFHNKMRFLFFRIKNNCYNKYSEIKEFYILCA